MREEAWTRREAGHNVPNTEGGHWLVGKERHLTEKLDLSLALRAASQLVERR